MWISLRATRCASQPGNRTTPHVTPKAIELVAVASAICHLVESQRLRDRMAFSGSWLGSEAGTVGYESGHDICEFDEAPCQGWITQTVTVLGWKVSSLNCNLPSRLGQTGCCFSPAQARLCRCVLKSGRRRRVINLGDKGSLLWGWRVRTLQ